MEKWITIKSFRGWMANDKNAWQEWAFWNSKNINYRTNTQYIELAKQVRSGFTIAGIPSALTFWGTTGTTIVQDIVVFASDWVYNSIGKQSSTTWILNVAEVNWKKYCVTNKKIYEYSTIYTQTLLHTFTKTSECRPILNFYWDLIIWDGTSLIRYNKDTTIYEEANTWEKPILTGLNWTVRAITQIGVNIYVWCDDGTNTNVYIWDWLSERPSQPLTYADKSVKNVALLGNTHYWWSSKSDQSIKEVLVGESYKPQVYVKSCYPNYPLITALNDEENRMAIATLSTNSINAIETVSDIVYLPWYWRIFGFGSYFPWDKQSFNTEFTFTGTNIQAMASWGTTGAWRDAGWFLAFSCKNGSTYDINIINFWQQGVPGLWAIYNLTGELESMEYVATSFADWENDKKLIVPFELPDESCSIKIYEKRNRGSYTLLKELTYTDYPWYKVAEIATVWTWRTKQFKFELITTDSEFSPKLYVWFTNQVLEVWKK